MYNDSSEFKILETGSSFISKNAQEFSEKYPKKFVAVFDSELIAVDDNFDNILIKIKERHIDPSMVLVEYIPPKGQIILY